MSAPLAMAVGQQRLGRLAVIGLGLIGGSLARGLRETGLFAEVIGIDLEPKTRRLAVELGVADRCEAELAAAQGADVIVLAVPVLTMAKVLGQLDLGTSVITDVGSAKGVVVDMARQLFGRLPSRFIPGHPIAGSEKNGVAAARGNLFVGHRVILTPQEDSEPAALALVEALWLRLGAIPEQMSVERHDRLLAGTSHLPHLLAYALVGALAKGEDGLDIFRYAGGGFRDFSRIAGSNAALWRDIFLANREPLLASLEQFRAELAVLGDAVAQADGQQLLTALQLAQEARQHFDKITAHQISAPAKYESSMQSSSSVTFIAKPGGRLSGSLRVPGDKSISHRAIMLGSLAQGITEVSGFLEGQDALATLQAFCDMGVVIEGPEQGRVTIHGVGLYGLKKPAQPLYLGNSGTSMRLLAGLLVGQRFDSELTGDASLSKRPMNRVVEPLRQMGAVIDTDPQGRAPLKIHGGQPLHGISYDMPMASAQVKSCLLLAGLYAGGRTSVREPAPARDHSERMLRGFGYEVHCEGPVVSLVGGGHLRATSIDVPADLSSAAFFLVAASIALDSELLLEHVGVNPTRAGVLEILQLMGADLSLENLREVGGEPVADIRVRSAQLHGIEIPHYLVPLAIDEFPVLFVAAACASGRTLLTGAEELRVKESDRIQVMADGLKALGVQVETWPDGISIEGGPISGGEIDSHGDHRIAMSFSVAALRASGSIRIRDCANVATSFPNFVELANQAGLTLESEAEQ